MEDLKELGDKCNPWLITDLLAAAALSAAAVRLSDYNVRVNVPNLADKDAGKEVRQSSADDLDRADKLLGEIEQATKSLLP
jgi:formiminotetrahydrofolate cyclodeaminase